MKLISAPLLRWRWLFLAGILLIGTISYISPESASDVGQLSSGRYLLEASQNGEEDVLNGPVYFEYTNQKERLMATRIFKLHFVNSATSEGPGYGFLIPLSDLDGRVGMEVYSVDPERKGFMNGTGSVFGYADLRGASPSLYFTKSGSISIITTSPEEISGNIDMVLTDGRGNAIHLEGSFRALPLPPGLSL